MNPEVTESALSSYNVARAVVTRVNVAQESKKVGKRWLMKLWKG